MASVGDQTHAPIDAAVAAVLDFEGGVSLSKSRAWPTLPESAADVAVTLEAFGPAGSCPVPLSAPAARELARELLLATDQTGAGGGWRASRGASNRRRRIGSGGRRPSSDPTN